MKTDNLLLAGDVKAILKNMGLIISSDLKPLGERDFSINNGDISQVNVFYATPLKNRIFKTYDAVPINRADIYTKKFTNEWMYTPSIFGADEIKRRRSKMNLENDYLHDRSGQILQYKKHVDLTANIKKDNEEIFKDAILGTISVTRLIGKTHKELMNPINSIVNKIVEENDDEYIGYLNNDKNR